MKQFCLLLILFAFSFQLFAEESTVVETYHPHKKVGIALIVTGAVIAAGGITGFSLASDKEFDKYKKMKDYDNALEAVTHGEKQQEYLDRADSYRKKANTYRSLEIVTGVIGFEMLLTRIIVAAVREEKKAENVSLTDISLTPLIHRHSMSAASADSSIFRR